MNYSKRMLCYLAILSMIAFIATDMYFPAFKDMEDSLSTGPEQVAFSLSIFLVGLSIGQLLWGVISDKIGQVNSLLLGLFIFTLASMGLSLHSEVWQLWSLRFIQAIGVSSPAVVWQAFVIKRFPKKETQQLFSTIMPLVALSPALAPQIGLILLDYLGWTSIFISMTVIGVALIVATLFIEKDAPSDRKSNILSDIKSILKVKEYVGNVAMYAMSSATYFAYITGIPQIMIEFGYSSREIALSFIPQTLAFIIGGIISKKALNVYSDKNVLFSLICVFVLSSLSVFFVTLTDFSNVFYLLIPFWLIAMMNGAMYPIFVNRALSSVSNDAPATAAGIQNSLVILISSLSSAAIASFASIPITAIGLIVLGCGVLFLVGYETADSVLVNKYIVSNLCIKKPNESKVK